MKSTPQIIEGDMPTVETAIHLSTKEIQRKSPINEASKAILADILKTNAFGMQEQEIQDDLEKLSVLAGQIRTLTQQYVLLHGKKIKEAHDILRKYNKNAINMWNIASYGNTQTPYNFLNYYLFYQQCPEHLRAIFENVQKCVAYFVAKEKEHSPEEKLQFLLEHKTYPSDRLLEALRNRFTNGGTRTGRNASLQRSIIHLRHAADRLSSVDEIDRNSRKELEKLIVQIEQILRSKE